MSTTTDQTITIKDSAVTYQRGQRIRWGKIASYTVLVIFAVIYLGPLLMLINTSLKVEPSFHARPDWPCD
jgi:ABC-type glycerol-3-phosphate transport system permease component